MDEPIRKVVLSLLEATEEEMNIMSANITKTLQEERENTIEQGIEQGEKKMLAKGMSVEEVIDLTGISKEDIEEVE